MNLNTTDLGRYRTLMGAAITRTAALPGARLSVADDHWIALTGLPDADLNMAFIQSAEPTTLAGALAEITEVGCPALLMFAGDGAALVDQLPQHWQSAGEMPMMAVDPRDAPRATDPRVRTGTLADTPVIASLMTDAYGSDLELNQRFIAAILQAARPECRWWLLEADGVPVSTVLSVRVEDAVTLWCMATPAQFGRQGYGRALLATVLDWATADGARVGLLGATPAGEPLYTSTGWKSVDTWVIFLNAPSVQFP